MSCKVLNNVETNSTIGDNQNSDVNTINEDNINVHGENNSEKSIEENETNATNQFPETCPDESVTSDSINNISIETLDDDNEDSSVVDSDSDCENHIQSNNSNEFRTSSGIVLVNKSAEKSNSHSSSDSKPNFGSIAIQNSQDITFGDKTYNQGTVNYYINSQSEWKKVDPNHTQHNTQHNSDGNIANSTDNIMKKGKSHPN